MTNHDPNKRPTLEQARHIMNAHFVGLSGWRMRWPILPPDTTFRQRWTSVIAGITAEVILFLKRVLSLLLLRG
jgi:hypothetical protein